MWNTRGALATIPSVRCAAPGESPAVVQPLRPEPVKQYLRAIRIRWHLVVSALFRKRPFITAGLGHDSRRKFLDRLFKSHWVELRNVIAARYGAGPPEPEDIVQAAFAQVAALEQPETLDNPRAFLYRTAHNLYVDHRRRMATQRKFVVEAENREVTDPGYELPTERVLIGQEDYRLIEAAILQMPVRRRQCFLLHRLHGLSYAEIGRRVGMSGVAVQKNVEKALEVCQLALEEAGHQRNVSSRDQ